MDNKYNVLSILDIEIKGTKPKPLNKKWRKELKRRAKKKKPKNRIYKRKPKHYKTYIKSEWWEERKKLYWRKHRKVCYRCNSAKYIDLHHIKYNWAKFGNEPDEDLIPMCRECHSLFHSLYGVKQDMLKDMMLFEEEHPYIDTK